MVLELCHYGGRPSSEVRGWPDNQTIKPHPYQYEAGTAGYTECTYESDLPIIEASRSEAPMGPHGSNLRLIRSLQSVVMAALMNPDDDPIPLPFPRNRPGIMRSKC
jgi:hypothetical protein